MTVPAVTDSSFDLLGLGALEAPEHSARPQSAPIQAASAPPPVAQPVASAPPSAVAAPAQGAAAPSSGAAEVNGREGTTTVTDFQRPQSGAPLDPGSRRFVVRCEGRWRVRSAPSLSSKVIGTVANGTVVIAREEPGEGAFSLHSGTNGTDSTAQGGAYMIGSLWVRVTRFEAQEPMGVSEIKRDTASGGELYCLRRNALGYGLYEVGIEPLDGPLITLPENLSSELRSDAQRAAADKAEDVSLTWKLLSAAESVGKFFRAMSGVDEGGVNEDMKPQVRRRPEEVFEVRQREQLKKSAGTLKKATQKIIEKANGQQGDVLANMQKEVSRRYARLRSSLAETTQSAPLIVSPQTTPHAIRPARVSEGSIQDLEHFSELLARLERTGGWPELGGDLRQEVINFCTKHTTDLEVFARSLGKSSGLERLTSTDSASGSMAALSGPCHSAPVPRLESPAGTPSVPRGPLPLLPPPPKSSAARGVGEGGLL